jgi:hypothetical protein
MTQDRRSFLQFLALAPVAAVVPLAPTQPTVLTIAHVHRCRDMMRLAEAQQFANRYQSRMVQIMNETAKGRIIANG